MIKEKTIKFDGKIYKIKRRTDGEYEINKGPKSPEKRALLCDELSRAIYGEQKLQRDVARIIKNKKFS
ncbi:MAG: hypothetical protein HQL26_06435 [Candidatus Omnitrophica bacterium]|nr:hypothetical protein [Candidatus Omnitrophota bacterium]